MLRRQQFVASPFPHLVSSCEITPVRHLLNARKPFPYPPSSDVQATQVLAEQKPRWRQLKPLKRPRLQLYRITSRGGTSRSETSTCWRLSVLSSGRPAHRISITAAGKTEPCLRQCAAFQLVAVAALLALLTPDAASAEGLIPVGLFQSWLVRLAVTLCQSTNP